MRRKLQSAVLVLMIAMLPLRALATVTIGFCALHQTSDAAFHAHGQGHDGHTQGKGKQEQCNACVEHCASSVIASPDEVPAVSTPISSRITSGQRAVTGFVPWPPDRPPVVL